MAIAAADPYARGIAFVPRFLEMRIGDQHRHRMAGGAERIGRGDPIDFGAGDDTACADHSADHKGRAQEQPPITWHHRLPAVDRQHELNSAGFERVNIGHDIPDLPITEYRPRWHR